LNSPCYFSWLPLYQQTEIHTMITPVRFEQIKIQFPTSHEIALPNLNHFAKLGDTPPRCVQQLARQRVEHQVDASAPCRLEDAVQKGCVSRGKDAAARDVKRRLQVFYL
jgi:hypothetical protein